MSAVTCATLSASRYCRKLQRKRYGKNLIQQSQLRSVYFFVADEFRGRDQSRKRRTSRWFSRAAAAAVAAISNSRLRSVSEAANPKRLDYLALRLNFLPTSSRPRSALLLNQRIHHSPPIKRSFPWNFCERFRAAYAHQSPLPESFSRLALKRSEDDLIDVVLPPW